MNPPNRGPSLVPFLVRKAARQRSIVHLATAFRAQKPEWGSQALLAALGLSDYLTFIRWDFTIAEESVPYWLEEAQEVLDPKIVPIRVAQLRELNTMLNEPRAVPLNVNPDAPMDEELARILVYLANYGVLYSDFEYLANAAMVQHDDASSYLDVLGTYYPLIELTGEVFDRRQPDLLDVTPLQYLEAVDRPTRIWHPNALRTAILDYLEKVGRISHPFASVEGSSYFGMAAVPTHHSGSTLPAAVPLFNDSEMEA